MRFFFAFAEENVRILLKLSLLILVIWNSMKGFILPYGFTKLQLVPYQVESTAIPSWSYGYVKLKQQFFCAPLTGRSVLLVKYYKNPRAVNRPSLSPRDQKIYKIALRLMLVWDCRLNNILVCVGNNTEAQEFLGRGGQVIIRMRGLPYDCSPKQVVSIYPTLYPK